MLKVLQYGGLTTKVRAMRGKLLKKSEYQRLTEATSVSEFVDQLKNIKHMKMFLKRWTQSLYTGVKWRKFLHIAYIEISLRFTNLPIWDKEIF